MKSLTIFVDMDGTIEKLMDVWVKRLNERYNQSVTVDEITEWDVSKAYKNLTLDQVLSVIDDDDTVWVEIEPMEGAAEVLQHFIDIGHKVYIVTSTPYKSIKAKMEDLLFRCFPFIDWHHVIITHNKQLLSGDIMIDDALHNLIGGHYMRILYDAPYNRDVDDDKEELIRVHSWAEIKGIVDKIC